MQKRKFDELISYFNRKVSDMSIDQKYKMELLGMISAIGFAHEKELSTNLASLGTNCISRQQAIDAIKREKVKVFHELYDEAWNDAINGCMEVIGQLPPIHPEIVRCKDCKHYEHGICKKAGLCINKSPNGFCDWGERREVTT